jgi:hypothetical protein
MLVEDHGDLLEQNCGPGQFRACHGSDYRGTVLSRAQGDRTFTTTFGAVWPRCCCRRRC